MELTPVETRNGLLYKREDLYAEPVYGVNGSKFRAARHLMSVARSAGLRHVVTGAPVNAPTLAIVGYAAAEAGLGCSVVVATKTKESALTRRSCGIASECGADMVALGRGMYAPLLRKNVLEVGAGIPGALVLEHGITVPDDAPRSQVEAFLSVGGGQVQNLPETVRTLVVPLGGGNSAAGVLYGVAKYHPAGLERVVLVGIGPDRLEWLRGRLASVGLPLVPDGVEVKHLSTYPHYAAYGDKMPEELDGIAFHPTYEGKIIRYLNQVEPGWWTDRDGTTCFWIVGGQF